MPKLNIARPCFMFDQDVCYDNKVSKVTSRKVASIILAF